MNYHPGLHKVDTDPLSVEMYESPNQPFDWIASYARPAFCALLGAGVGAALTLVYLVHKFH